MLVDVPFTYIIFLKLSLVCWCGFMQCISIIPIICYCNHCKSLTLAAVYCAIPIVNVLSLLLFLFTPMESAIMTLMPYKECTIYKTVVTSKAASHHEFHAIQ